MRSLLKLSAMLVTLALSASAFADDIYLGEPGYAGTGCPAGSASVTLSPDSKQLSILFDQYLLEAGGITGRRNDRKSCNIAIPVHVPQGFSVSIFAIDYRGYNLIPQGGQSRFQVEYFFAGQRGPSAQRIFSGPTDSDFTFTNNLQATALVWSACGADVNLRVNSSMTLQTNNRGDQAMSSVDSMDISSGIVYHLQWKRCN